MLSQYKKNTLKSIDAMANAGSLLFPTNLQQIEDFKKAIDSTQSLDEYVEKVMSINIPSISLFYNGVNPIKSKPEKNLDFKFNDTAMEWYFMYGRTKTYSFTYVISRIGTNVLDKNECLYSINGGFGIKSKWYPFNQNVGEGLYKTNSDTISFTYNNKGINTNFKLNKNNLSIDVSLKINGNIIIFNLTAQNSMNWNGKNGCVPACFGNIGGIYSSLTNCLCSIKYNDNSKEINGLGWFDHQSVLGGIPRGRIQKLLFSFLKGNKIIQQLRWVWITIQLKDIQYQFSHVLTNNDIPLKINSSFEASAVKYTKNSVEYHKTAKITIKKIKNYKDYSFPIEYLINIDNRNFTLQSIIDLGIIILPNGITNWEAPSNVLENGNNIGNGFLEAFNLSSSSTSNFVEYKLLTNNYLLIRVMLLILILTTCLSIKYYHKNKILLSIITFIVTFLLLFNVLI